MVDLETLSKTGIKYKGWEVDSDTGRQKQGGLGLYQRQVDKKNKGYERQTPIQVHRRSMVNLETLRKTGISECEKYIHMNCV